MPLFLSCLFILILTGCQNAGGSKVLSDTFTRGRTEKIPGENTAGPVGINKDSVVPKAGYEWLDYQKVELLHSAPGTKSVLFNSTGTKLYAMNLEGMSVYEFDQHTRKISREFKFKPTKGMGWDYVKEKPISSFQEKPVEACLSHDDKILWVSLHNAGGIVPIRLDTIIKTNYNDQPVKKITLIYPDKKQVDSFEVPLIKTGKTPKVIAKTRDSKFLLVSNWHSYNVSVLELNKDEYPYGKVISTIPVSSIPRGIAVDDSSGKTYVAIMGGASVAVILNSVWLKEKDLEVASNPRHILTDSSGRLFVSYNSLAKIACIEAETGKTLFTASTHAQPRTIMLSKNQKFLFVTCYSSDMVDVFKINDESFTKIISLPCKGHPVGVDIFENEKTVEAWVCSYSSGSISIYSFNKK
jgi:DNA-binding beta-propeller fold protein YncE